MPLPFSAFLLAARVTASPLLQARWSIPLVPFLDAVGDTSLMRRSLLWLAGAFVFLGLVLAAAGAVAGAALASGEGLFNVGMQTVAVGLLAGALSALLKRR